MTDDRVLGVSTQRIHAREAGDVVRAVSRLSDELSRVTHQLGRYRLAIGETSASGPLDANSDLVDPTGSGVVWISTDGSRVFFDVPPTAAAVSAGTATYAWVELYPTMAKAPISGGEVDTTNFAGVLSAADDTIQEAFDTLDDHNHDATYLGLTAQAADSDTLDGSHLADITDAIDAAVANAVRAITIAEATEQWALIRSGVYAGDARVLRVILFGGNSTDGSAWSQVSLINCVGTAPTVETIVLGGEPTAGVQIYQTASSPDAFAIWAHSDTDDFVGVRVEEVEETAELGFA